LFLKQAAEVDIIITTALIPGKPAPKLLFDYHVEAMKPGSVIIDLAASAGGNCDLTKPNEIIVTKNGVTIAGKVDQLPNQASFLYGNNVCNMLDDMGDAENFNINMNDDVVKRAMVSYQGNINWPPEPLAVTVVPQKDPEIKKDREAEKAKKAKKMTYVSIVFIFITGALLLLLGKVAPTEFLGHVTAFALAVFVGWNVIWNVTHALHTPLMSVSNAISGIIVMGGLLQINDDWSSPISILAFIAILLAAINIVGGFTVTYRMLKMFKK
ncbi:MAG: proton-translocating transhydrogenase family protein, partial [Bacteroidales bacterium]|nr:proton-translocating transhydrogenase family protein [Bacteroidales bacterium]